MSTTRPSRWAALLLACCCALVQAGEPGLRFCAEDESSYPWMLKERPGLNLIMMDMLESRLGMDIEIQLLPWKRCLMSLQEGRVDGAFKASFSEERLKLGSYPMLGNKPDPGRAMLEESYHLYRIKGSPVEPQDGKVRNLRGAIGAQAGFSIVDQLKAQGLQVDAVAKAPELVLTKLMRGRIGAAALQSSQGDHALATQPEMAAVIERVGAPLAAKPYYLMLSRQLQSSNPALAERIWDGVAAVRESPEYKRALASFR